MKLTDRVVAVVPVIKHNNRRRALAFYEKTLGMKNLLEEGAWVSLGDKSSTEKLIVEESPSMRTRKVVGDKKLARIVIKVEDAQEITALLARGADFTQLYQGKSGYAFESLSPEGDVFLLHSEEDKAHLEQIEKLPPLEEGEDFTGLTHFEIEKIDIRVKDREASQAFYQPILGEESILSFIEGKGQDLDRPAEETWDLSSLKLLMDGWHVNDLEAIFAGQDYFLPKSKKFMTVSDPSQIDLWLEKYDG